MNLVSAQNSDVFAQHPAGVRGSKAAALTLAPAKERDKELEHAGRGSKMSIASLSAYYGKFRALASISMEIPENRITSIIGPSGCGKSTLLRSINRMNDLAPNFRLEGSIMLDGENVYAEDVDVTDVRRRVGMVFQRPNPFPMSIFDNVAFGPRLYGMGKGHALTDLVEHSLKQAALWEEIIKKRVPEKLKC